MHRITPVINGKKYELDVEDNELLVDVLRDTLHITGTKKGCGTGECGVCTVLLNGEPVNSCLVLAARTGDSSIMTIEGVGGTGTLHPLQKKFVEKGAFQCGFCAPGMVLSSLAMLKKTPHPSKEDIKRGLSGNICRCTGYANIVKAIEEYSEETT